MTDKRIVSLAAAAALLASTCATAASLEVYDAGAAAWLSAGNVVYTGPVSLSFLGITLPCSSAWNVAVSAGAGQVTSMTQSGSSACAGAIAYNLPWPLAVTGAYTGPNPPFAGAPFMTPPLYTVSIAGVRIYAPPPLNVSCPTGTATIVAVIDANGKIVFKQMLGPCSFQTQRGESLTPAPAVRVVP